MTARTLLLLACACGSARSEALREGPIVVELFTSQGCSSCPPADRLLSSLAQDDKLAPLSFHVDYWNDLGWVDPFASPAWTERQHRYAQALGDARVYTPELVIGGARGMVGSQELQITAAIAGTEPPALLAATAAWSERTVVIATTAPVDADVLVAIYENETRTKIARGENAGETLRNDRVVRRLEQVARAGSRGRLEIPLDPAWRSVGAVAFAQRRDQRIVASIALPRP